MKKASRHVQPYPPEFRAEAIRLARTSGKPHVQIAEDLGMTSETLRLWLKQADLDKGKRRDGLTSDEQKELRRLRRENRILREEREILRKAEPSSLRRPTRSGEGLQVCGAREGPSPRPLYVPNTRCLPRVGIRRWRGRELTARVRANAQMTQRIVQIHKASRGTYGALRVHAELVASGSGADSSLRSWAPVHLPALRPALPGFGDSVFYGLGGGLL
jgi:transposase